jgi:hypothetical protein
MNNIKSLSDFMLHGYELKVQNKVRCGTELCASLHKMADKRRLSVEQQIKTVLFTETRSVVVT